jgi:AraC-like DNA-binding protein
MTGDDATSATPGGSGSFQVSTEHLRPADRVPFWRDVIGSTVARFELEPAGEQFSYEGRFCRLHDLRLSYVAGSAHRARWSHIETEGAATLTLVTSLAGAGRVSHLGREVSIPAGGSILLSSADPTHMEWTPSRCLFIRVPQSALAPMLSSPDMALMRVMPGSIEPLRLLTGYVDMLIKDPALTETAELRRLAVNHTHDLVAMAAGATRDAAEIAAGRGLRAARMRAIKADIAQNLDSDVSVAALAMRHRVTPRYIRKLFEGEGTSLSRFVRGQRLMHVHRMLADRRHADRAICDIAFAAGFGDLSTFNRDFRRRFGMTPSDVRAAARSGII